MTRTTECKDWHLEMPLPKPERRPRARRREYHCSLCKRSPPFCFACAACRFQICQDCMRENEWGMSCNKVTWVCPDCGHVNVL